VFSPCQHYSRLRTIVDVLSGANKSCFRKARRRRGFKGKSIPCENQFYRLQSRSVKKTPLLGSISESTLARIERECQKSQKLIATLQANMVDRAESARQRVEALKAKDGRVARPGRDG